METGLSGNKRPLWNSSRMWLKRFLASPLGQSLPELHMVLFLFGGRFLEIGRRITGLGHVSGLALNGTNVQLSTSKSPSSRPTYEPLGLMLALPLLLRLWRSLRTQDSSPTEPATGLGGALIHSSPAQQPEISDEANTYLSINAREQVLRHCILCLEARGTGEGSGGTVAVTECGHSFCWGCLRGLDRVSDARRCELPSSRECRPSARCADKRYGWSD